MNLQSNKTTIRNSKFLELSGKKKLQAMVAQFNKMVAQFNKMVSSFDQNLKSPFDLIFLVKESFIVVVSLKLFVLRNLLKEYISC